MSSSPVPSPPPPQIHPKSPPTEPIIAALLSVVIPGLGQIIAGQTTKGIVVLIVSLFAFTVLFVGGVIIIFPCCLIPFVPIVPALDAFLIAKKLQEGKSVGEWEFF